MKSCSKQFDAPRIIPNTHVNSSAAVRQLPGAVDTMLSILDSQPAPTSSTVYCNIPFYPRSAIDSPKEAKRPNR
ncbi:hypothetical protein VTJ04DRAFT_6832 [Mycothermus thermophilus]|uniref:uncharacterized protein n=1 Tax=Humicola insolens TaxID=85995 RepID=UPI003741F5DD